MNEDEQAAVKKSESLPDFGIFPNKRAGRWN
jgi:hypothetical protein